MTELQNEVFRPTSIEVMEPLDSPGISTRTAFHLDIERFKLCRSHSISLDWSTPQLHAMCDVRKPLIAVANVSRQQAATCASY